MLSGQIRDQAALYGLLAKVRDMGLFLMSVKSIPGKSSQMSKNEIGDVANDS